MCAGHITNERAPFAGSTSRRNTHRLHLCKRKHNTAMPSFSLPPHPQQKIQQALRIRHESVSAAAFAPVVSTSFLARALQRFACAATVCFPPSYSLGGRSFRAPGLGSHCLHVHPQGLRVSLFVRSTARSRARRSVLPRARAAFCARRRLVCGRRKARTKAWGGLKMVDSRARFTRCWCCQQPAALARMGVRQSRQAPLCGVCARVMSGGRQAHQQHKSKKCAAPVICCVVGPKLHASERGALEGGACA